MPYYNEKNKIASMKYIKDKQRSISLLFSKEQYEKIIEPAIKKTGLPVATFIKQAIMEKIERDNLIEEVSDIGNMTLNKNTCVSLDNKDFDPDGRKDINTTNDDRYPELSEAMRYYKETEGGQEKLCKLVEDYAYDRELKGYEKGLEEGRLEAIRNMIELGLTKDHILKKYSEEEYQKAEQ